MNLKILVPRRHIKLPPEVLKFLSRSVYVLNLPFVYVFSPQKGGPDPPFYELRITSSNARTHTRTHPRTQFSCTPALSLIVNHDLIGDSNIHDNVS